MVRWLESWACGHDEDLSRRHQDLPQRAVRGIEDLNPATHPLYEKQRRKLREARRRLRLLPSASRAGRSASTWR